jgi:uncharacterized caspase-like protein
MDSWIVFALVPLVFCLPWLVVYLQNKIEEETQQEEEEEETKKEKPTIPYEDKYKDKWKQLGTKEYTKEEWDGFRSKILVEMTPLGNVLMYWDAKKELFVYFSDTAIPYRYLETVARKYIVKFDCKAIYVDMDEELERAKEALQKKKEEKEKEKEREKAREKEPTQEKKSVFAKLKQYNQGTKPTPTQETKPTPVDDKEYLLKERSNRYAYEGKMMNFPFLKKIDRSCVDKNYKMTFKDFKEKILSPVKA